LGYVSSDHSFMAMAAFTWEFESWQSFAFAFP
jgi:hypothetical protein